MVTMDMLTSERVAQFAAAAALESEIRRRIAQLIIARDNTPQPSPQLSWVAYSAKSTGT